MITDSKSTSWKDTLRLIGPGLVWATAAIGSGELIITTKVGAEYGYAFIWALWVGLYLKYWIQKGILDLSVITGKPVIELWFETKFGKWISIYWLLFFVLTLTGVSGLIGLTASALNALLPGIETRIWAVITTAMVIGFAYTQKYERFEKVMLITAAITVIGAVGVVILSRPAPLSIFEWEIPSSLPVVLILLSLLGWGAGSGPDLMIPYSWWVVEKGYHELKPDKSSMAKADDTTIKFIKKWLNISTWDNVAGYVVTGLVASAFMIAGAAILRPRGILVDGLDVLKNVATIFTETYGGWAFVIFIFSAGAALFDTGLGVFDGARITIAHIVRLLLGKLPLPITEIRSNSGYRVSLIVCSIIPLAIFLGLPNPVLLIIFSSIVSAVSMPLLGILVYWSLLKQIPLTFRPNKFHLVNLGLAVIVYLFFTVQSLLAIKF